MRLTPCRARRRLHHDSVDNLYVLLRGRKRVRLFAPSDGPYLYARGGLVRVYPNGEVS